MLKSSGKERRRNIHSQQISCRMAWAGHPAGVRVLNTLLTSWSQQQPDPNSFIIRQVRAPILDWKGLCSIFCWGWTGIALLVSCLFLPPWAGVIFLFRTGGREMLQEEEKSLEGFCVRPTSEHQKYDRQLQGGKLNGF